MSSSGELFSFEETQQEIHPDGETVESAAKIATKAKKNRGGTTPAPEISNEPPVKKSAGVDAFVLSALPTLGDPMAVRDRAAELLLLIDPQISATLPESLPFPPEDDPFVKTLEEWEAEWYGVRESAYRVYLNLRMEFRKQLTRAAHGEPHDLKPWSHWVFNGARPNDREPVYGLSEERRRELGWDYPGPARDFLIYASSAEED